jgi:antitoxin component of MazEF toxin-antitoxin module
MGQILRHARSVLRPGGRCCVVVGNSAYGGVIIPTDALIAHLGFRHGFDKARLLNVRHLTVAPQQRGALADLQQFMRESVVVLS